MRSVDFLFQEHEYDQILYIRSLGQRPRYKFSVFLILFFRHWCFGGGIGYFLKMLFYTHLSVSKWAVWLVNLIYFIP